jgi:tripartite-type tricarboxylate transporter receptor subunit TctC
LSIINRDVTRILASPAMREQLGAQGLQAIPTTADAFSKALRLEIDKWRGVVEASGVRAE